MPKRRPPPPPPAFKVPLCSPLLFFFCLPGTPHIYVKGLSAAVFVASLCPFSVSFPPIFYPSSLLAATERKREMPSRGGGGGGGGGGGRGGRGGRGGGGRGGGGENQFSFSLYLPPVFSRILSPPPIPPSLILVLQ